MPDAIRCCILGVCCPPGSAEQAEALATYLATHLGDKAPDRELLEKLAGQMIADFKILSWQS